MPSVPPGCGRPPATRASREDTHRSGVPAKLISERGAGLEADGSRKPARSGREATGATAARTSLVGAAAPQATQQDPHQPLAPLEAPAPVAKQTSSHAQQRREPRGHRQVNHRGHPVDADGGAEAGHGPAGDGVLQVLLKGVDTGLQDRQDDGQGEPISLPERGDAEGGGIHVAGSARQILARLAPVASSCRPSACQTRQHHTPFNDATIASRAPRGSI
jgi:hypothetical protein